MASELGQNTQQQAKTPHPVTIDDYFGFEVWDPDIFVRQASPNSFRVAGHQEMPAAHKLAEDIMQMRLAPLPAMAAAHRKSQGTAWLHETATGEGLPGLSGIILLLPLTWDGEAALRTGTFNFSEPPLRHISAPDEEMAAVYLWLCAGTDRSARRNIMRTANAWFDGPCSNLRVYGRAASQEGLQAFASFGFRRLSQARSDIFFLARQGR